MRQIGGSAVLRTALIGAAATLLAACGYAPTTSRDMGYNTTTKFSQAEYGKASERKVAAGKAVPKGGGYYSVGKPYQVRGKWYHPQEDPNYRTVGLASWYGPNFHGRQTANGEIYDMHALSAAHPTLPLPSYARVTNMDNGRSIVVRINDRGPYAHDRVIDLSARAAQVLDFVQNGTAKVEVRYIGRAKLEGSDDAMLMASYRGPGEYTPGERQVAQHDTPFAIASMPAPKTRPGDTLRSSDPIGGLISTVSYSTSGGMSTSAGFTQGGWQPALLSGSAAPGVFRSSSSYAETALPSAGHTRVAALAAGGDRAAAALSVADERPVLVQAGIFSNAENAARLAASLDGFGEAEVKAVEIAGRLLHVVLLKTSSDADADAAIEAAARNGAPGARRVAL